MKEDTIFKKCPNCGFVWQDRKTFLSDAKVSLVGYQAHFEELCAGFFLFNHSCGTTFAVQVEQFKDLYSGEIFEENLNGKKGCPGYCFKSSELRPCPMRCECAFVRDIIRLVREK